MFYQKAVLKLFAIFTGKTVLESLFYKIAGLYTCNFIKKRLLHRSFPVNIAEFLKKTFLNNIHERFLLLFKVYPSISLRQMCPHMKLFMVRILPYSDWIRKDSVKNSIIGHFSGSAWSELLFPYYQITFLPRIFLHLKDWGRYSRKIYFKNIPQVHTKATAIETYFSNAASMGLH